MTTSHDDMAERSGTPFDADIKDGHTARAMAAQLFAAAARDDSTLPVAARLRVLEAQTALQTAADPTAPTTGSPVELIRQALAVLGGLSADDFADPRVRSAARLARRALREAATE